MFEESKPADALAGQQCALYTALDQLVPVEAVSAIPAVGSPYPRDAIEVDIKRKWDHLPDVVARRVADKDAPWPDLKIRRVDVAGTPAHHRAIIW